MNRAEALKAALGRILQTADRNEPGSGFAAGIARSALDLDYPWPGEATYNAPEDYAIAHKWMLEHAKADELIFVKGRPIIALYYEPVADHYQQARKLFREFAERLRAEFEADWS